MLENITELGKRIGAARYRNLLVTMIVPVRLRTMIGRLLLVLAAYPLLPSLEGQTMKAPDISKDPTLYVVPYAHLDTQWRWEMPQTISEYLLKTMRVNFEYIDKYPHYVFNWTGSNRYRLMKEYFPDDYAKVTQYVAAGR
jgi:alpha-mannosidase